MKDELGWFSVTVFAVGIMMCISVVYIVSCMIFVLTGN